MLDMAQLNALRPADRDRYRALEKLFSEPGWKVVIALAKQRAAEQVQRAAFAQSWADNRVAIGAGAAWNEIANLEEATLAHYTSLVEQTALADALRDEERFE